MKKNQWSDEKTDQEYFDEILENDLKHSVTWQPKNIHLMPPVLKKKDYRELIGKIDDEIWMWTWDLVYAFSDPKIAKAMRDWAKQLDERKNERIPSL